MNENVVRPIALAQELPAFELSPNAQRIASDQEALAVARELAAEFAQGAAQRDRERRLPAKELDRFSGSGLWGITVSKAYSGAGVSFATLAQVIAIISAADPNLGQLPQNHLAALDAIRVTASEEQKRLWFGRALQGYRLGNAFSEAKSKHVGAFETTLRRDGDSFVVNGEKFYATGALFAHFIHIGAVDENGNVHLASARTYNHRQLVKLWPTDNGERQCSHRERSHWARGRDPRLSRWRASLFKRLRIADHPGGGRRRHRAGRNR
jgi:alkylation response protein AidB-like acyl-CoA dehydrogenase